MGDLLPNGMIKRNTRLPFIELYILGNPLVSNNSEKQVFEGGAMVDTGAETISLCGDLFGLNLRPGETEVCMIRSISSMFLLWITMLIGSIRFPGVDFEVAADALLMCRTDLLVMKTAKLILYWNNTYLSLELF
jgi:hypothetical protein